LIDEVQNFEATQYEVQRDYLTRSPKQQQHRPIRRRPPYDHHSGDETAAIEVVLDTSPKSRGKSPGRGWNQGRGSETSSGGKSPGRGWNRRRGSETSSGRKSPGLGWSRGRGNEAPSRSLWNSKNKASDALELPDLGTLSTSSSAESPHKQLNSPSITAATPRSISEAAKRKRFKEKYMDPNSNQVETRRCFSAFKATPHQQQQTAASSRKHSQIGESKSHSSRSTDQHSSQSTPVLNKLSSAEEPILVLSPTTRPPSVGGTKQPTNRVASPATGYGSPLLAKSTNGTTSPMFSPVPTPAVTAVASPVKPTAVVPKILQRFNGAKNRGAAAKWNEEKKEQDNVTPPEELIIKKSSKRDLLRTKSIMSEVSAASSFHDGMGEKNSVGGQTPTSEVGRMLRTIESSLDAATNTGKQIDRLLVYKTLLEVSDTVEDQKEREAMQHELSLLLERSQSDDKMAELRKKVLLGIPPPPPPSEPVKKVRITTPTEQNGGVPRETKISFQEIEPSKRSDRQRRNDDEEDDDEYDSDMSYDSAMSRDTINFLSELFSFEGFFGINTPDKVKSRKGKVGVRKLKDGTDDWSGFMEEHGLSAPRQRRKQKPVSLLRTYSEETGFTDDSAFTSRYSRADRSYFTAESQSQFTADFTADTGSYKSVSTPKEREQPAPSSPASSNRSWWRQKSQDNGARDAAGTSRKQGSEREKQPKKKSKSKDDIANERYVPKRTKSLRPPKDATKPRKSRRASSSSRRRREQNANDDDSFSLSSIESNLYVDKYANATQDTINLTQDTIPVDEEDWLSPHEVMDHPTAYDDDDPRTRSLSSRGRSREKEASTKRSQSFDNRRFRV